jgi:hypothetical protein
MKLAPLAPLTLALVACADPSPTTFTDGGADTLLAAGTYTWNFDDGQMPAEYFNVLGDWVVEGGELVQNGSFPSPDFPRIIIQDRSVTDFHLSVKCKSDRGDTDRACGLLFRAEDSDNYFITRSNALEDNVRLYRVVDGDRQEFASADRTVTPADYHTLEVDARGTRIEISWNGEVIMSEDDGTFARGAIGLWTKADSLVRFDDLVLVVP